MGITPQGVIAIGNALGITDIKECLYKVREIVSEVRSLTDSKKKEVSPEKTVAEFKKTWQKP